MKMIFFSVIIFSVQVFGSEKLLIPWESNSSPERMSESFEKKFSKLPLDGQVRSTTKFWSSDYWALFKGGINYRWNSVSPTGFNLKSPSFKEALALSQEDLKVLSPSEKYDLLQGRYDYPLKKEVYKRASPRRKEWEGICHGWAMAALNHPEPVPRILSNPDGLQIPFGSSDIKALLSYYYAYKYDPQSTHQMGRRCNGRRYCNKDDMNAGAFHIVLTNKIGLNGVGFIADIENKHEVWNQVARNYASNILENNLPPMKDSAKGTTSVVRLKTMVRFVFNIKSNSWFPANGTDNQTFKDMEYEYYLDLDKTGSIVGGKWISQIRPDFLWTVSATERFDGILKELPRLLIKE